MSKKKKILLELGYYFFKSVFSGRYSLYAISVDHEKQYAQILQASSKRAVHWKVKRANYQDMNKDNYIKLVIYED